MLDEEPSDARNNPREQPHTEIFCLDAGEHMLEGVYDLDWSAIDDVVPRCDVKIVEKEIPGIIPYARAVAAGVPHVVCE